MFENTNVIREKVGVDVLEKSSLPKTRRSIDAILARRSRRLQDRRESFAPDFLHGAAQLDEIYRALGYGWVEQAVFVERICNNVGEVLAVSVAYFNDYFLTIEQAVVGEVDDLDDWIEDRTVDRKTRVEFVLIEDGAGRRNAAFSQASIEGMSGVIPIFCGAKRLSDMESSLLSVTRDGNRGDRENIEYDSEAVLQDSRTNLLSLITLFSRLIAE